MASSLIGKALGARVLIGLLVAGLGAGSLRGSGAGAGGAKLTKNQKARAKAKAAKDLAAEGILNSVQVRGLLVHAGVDLRGADLRWADLRRCNLAGANLRHADLTGADLGGAIMTGTRLEGARLFEAHVSGAVGLDLTGAELHPFFEIAEGEKIGAVQFLNLSRSSFISHGFPQNLVCGPDGRLFWTEGTHPAIRSMSATGERSWIPPAGDTLMYSLIKDSKNRLWCFGNKMLGLFDLNTISTVAADRPVAFVYHNYPLPGPPNQVTAGVNGDVWVSLTDMALRLNREDPDGKFHVSQMKYQDPLLSSQSRVLATRDGSKVLFASPDSSNIFIYHVKEDRPSLLSFPEGGQPQRLVLGPDSRMWLTQRGLDGIGELDLDRLDGEVHPLAQGGEPHGIVPGPDGCMWFTETAGDRIGRITPEGEVETFPLPSGTRPKEIICSHDGRLFFTMVGRNSIGSIRALVFPPSRFRGVKGLAPAVAAAAKAAASASSSASSASAPAPTGSAADWEVAPYQPRPQRPKPATNAERRQAHDEKLERAEQRFQARLAAEPQEAAPPESWFQAQAPSSASLDLYADAQALSEGQDNQLGAALPAPPNAVDRLADMEVNLAPGATRHILREHGANSQRHKSRFAPRFQAKDALERLIARGLEEAGAIAKVKVTDAYGRYATLCKMNSQVGWYNAYGHLVPTKTFLVITEKIEADGYVEHDIRTAYPVSDQW